MRGSAELGEEALDERLRLLAASEPAPADHADRADRGVRAGARLAVLGDHRADLARRADRAQHDALRPTCRTLHPDRAGGRDPDRRIAARPAVQRRGALLHAIEGPRVLLTRPDLAHHLQTLGESCAALLERRTGLVEV